jgi:anti-anti-sigma factor
VPVGLTITLDERGPGWILTLSGDVEYGALHDLNDSVSRVLEVMPISLIADLTRVEYIDSSGVGMLLLLAKHYSGGGGALVLVVSDAVDLLLSLTRLPAVFCIAPDMQRAHEIVDQLS